MTQICRPPRLARTVVAWLLRGDMREIVLGDLDEEFTRSLERGATVSRATRRYWRQALASVVWRSSRPPRPRNDSWLVPGLTRERSPVARGETGVPGHLSHRDLTAGWATDLRDALRGLRVGRSTTALAFAMLTLGIAAGTVTFSVVDALAIRSLPYRDAARLVAVARVSPRGNYDVLAPQEYFALQRGVSVFDGLAAGSRSSLPGDTPDSPRIIGARTTVNFFDVLGVAPMLGRGFQSRQDVAGNDGVIVLSYHFWTQRFGSDPHVVGRQARFGTETREVLGVMPKDFAFWMSQGKGAEFWVPYVPSANDRSEASRGRAYFLQVFGRVHSTTPIDLVQSQVDTVVGRLMIPAFQRENRFVALPLQDLVIGPAKSWLLLMLAAVSLVLLASCINVANLLLARATTRRRELATREALGASRARLARSLLFEGLVLAGGAAVAGVTVSYWAVEAAKSLLPEGLARVAEISVNGRVLVASVSAAILCGLVFGTAPALQASRTDLVTAIKNDGAAVIGGRGQRRWLGAFLVAEIAFVVTLLVGTGLVVATFVHIETMDLGFDRRDVVTLSVMKSLAGVPKADRPAAAEAFLTDVTERARRVPGVIAAAIVQDGFPMSGNSARYSLTLPNGLKTEEGFAFHPVTSDYFRAMGIRLLQGRVFQTSDRGDGPLVAVINDTAARRFFPNLDPVGQIVTFRGPTTIVGVVAAAHGGGPEQEVQPELYVPLSQELQADSIPYGDLVVRAADVTPAFTARLAVAVSPALGNQKVPEPKPLDDFFRKVTAQRRLSAAVLSIFGLVSAIIAAIGIYGVIAFVVAQRVREIGLRMALGASSRSVLAGVIGGATKYVAAGVLIGLAGARATSRLFASLVFGMAPTDSRVYLAVAVVLLGIGMLAALAPARRAAHVDPLIALRSE